MASKKREGVYLAAALIGGAVLLFGLAQMRRGSGVRIAPQGGGRIVGGEYVTGIVDPYTGRYITGAELGGIDWGV